MYNENMIHKLTEYLTIDDGISFEDLFTSFQYLTNQSDLNSILNISYKLPRMYDENIRIKIQDVWYDVIPISKLVRTESDDGYFRAIYIWVNYDSGEYYIGKINAAKKNRLLSYTGSGVKFKPKYNAHKDKFVRYFIYYCRTSKETEDMEAKIVNHELLKDPFCLNCIQGGGKAMSIDYSEERRKKQKEYMKSHPERYQAMLDAVSNFTLFDIRKRGDSIKKTMSDDKYRKMFSERIKKWRKEHPEEYALAKAKNKVVLNDPKTREKRLKSRKKYKEEHPLEFAAWEERRKNSLASQETKKKMSESQKRWILEHPEEAKLRISKMSKAQKEKVAKKVEMYDLQSGITIKTFDSLAEAASYLRERGLTKGKNPASSISDVCRRKAVIGHGTKKTYLGYGWRFSK